MSDHHHIATALGHLQRAYEALATARRAMLGLNTNEEAALRLLAGGVTAPSELSRRIGMTTAGTTNMLDRLEQHELLRREPHLTDKRRVLLTLTKKGFRAQLELDAANDEVAALAAADPACDVAALARFLKAATEAIERRAERTVHPPPRSID